MPAMAVANPIYKPWPTTKELGGASLPWLAHTIRKIRRERISTHSLRSRWSRRRLRPRGRALRALPEGHGGGGGALGRRIGGRAGRPSSRSVANLHRRPLPTSKRPMPISLRRGRELQDSYEAMHVLGPSPRTSSSSVTTMMRASPPAPC
jgi:hypothetical protein